MADIPRVIAADLLKIGAVKLSPEEPFTWTSGLRSPIYCDNRLTISYPDVRRRITSGFATALEVLGDPPDIVAGTATAGIPHAAWLADRVGLPLAYVRGKAKGHGAGKQIEGVVTPGQRVVLIEDLISTGGSSVTAVAALRDAGLDVIGVLAIFSYGLPAAVEAFASADVRANSLTSIDALLDVAEETGALDTKSIASVRAWRDDPQAWSRSVSDEMDGSARDVRVNEQVVHDR